MLSWSPDANYLLEVDPGASLHHVDLFDAYDQYCLWNTKLSGHGRYEKCQLIGES